MLDGRVRVPLSSLFDTNNAASPPPCSCVGAMFLWMSVMMALGAPTPPSTPFSPPRFTFCVCRRHDRRGVRLRAHKLAAVARFLPPRGDRLRRASCAALAAALARVFIARVLKLTAGTLR